jgi:Alpha/beta hydrolase family
MNPMRNMMRKYRRFLLLIPLILVLALGGFVVWANTTPAPMDTAIAAMLSDDLTVVATDHWLVFDPVENEKNMGFIFYPGGRVAPESYAPAAHAIADEGYRVVIVPMPLNLAVLGPEGAKDVIAAYPEIQHWAIGGHSLGGSMAARFAYDNPDLIQGLVLWASYPEDSKNLADRDIVAASIYGTLDGLATVDKIDASRKLMPPDTAWVVIEGGNHAQFGWYGAQAGDNEAIISREAQQAQTVTATLELLDQLEAR